MKKIRKIAIRTSGGDAPGMNSFIRAAARTAIANGIQVVGIEEGYAGLLAGKFRDLSNPTSVSNILTEAGTVLYSARCEEFKDPKYQELAAYICRSNNIDGMIVCGGDGTFMGATKLSALGIPTVAVPGTIDADVTSTDYTIGFDTAMNTVVEMADSLRATSESHARCNVVEVMGRNAGHIAVRTGIAVGASAVAIPEVPFDEEEAIEKIKTQRLNGKRGIIVIVSEGLPGYAEKLSKKIEEETGITTRFCVLAHVQRGGCPTLEDRLTASEMGAAAVERLIEGKSNIVICKNDGRICDVDIMKALTLDKLYKGKLTEEEIAAIPAEDKAWMDERCAILKARTEEYYRLANLIR